MNLWIHLETLKLKLSPIIALLQPTVMSKLNAEVGF